MVDGYEMVIGGVTLAQFAFVRAGLADGLEIGELLGFLRIDVAVWEAAEEAWDERVLDAIEEDPSFLDAVDEASAEARGSWERRIPPLDEELRAWFDFLHAWLADPDPVAYLERASLAAADLAHLHKLWSKRLAESPELRAQAITILSGERGVPPVPKPERPRLIRRGAAADGESVTEEIARAQVDALPFAEGEPGSLPPPLAVPLPRRTRPSPSAPTTDVTQQEVTTSSAQALPFMAPGAFAQVAMFEASEPRPPPLREEPPRPALVAPSVVEVDLDATMAIDARTGAVVTFSSAFSAVPVDVTEPLLTLEQHAVLVAELTAGGDLAGLLARCGLTPEAKQIEDAHWARALDRDPEVRRAWMHAFDEARARLAATGEES